jgi:hypothetical protein
MFSKKSIPLLFCRNSIVRTRPHSMSVCSAGGITQRRSFGVNLRLRLNLKISTAVIYGSQDIGTKRGSGQVTTAAGSGGGAVGADKVSREAAMLTTCRLRGRTWLCRQAQQDPQRTDGGLKTHHIAIAWFRLHRSSFPCRIAWGWRGLTASGKQLAGVQRARPDRA